MNYKFANKVFKIETVYDFFKVFAKEYETKEAYDFEIIIKQEDIDQWRIDHNVESNYPHNYIETLVVQKEVAAFLSKFDTYIIHGSSIIYKNKGYIFIAPSGTGKSTHTRLLKEYLKDKMDYINDDKPFIDKDLNLYGSPWDGKEKLSKNIRFPLSGVFVLKRSNKPEYRKLSPKEAVVYLYKQIHIVKQENTLDFIIKLCNKVPIYLIGVNMEKESILQTISIMDNNI